MIRIRSAHTNSPRKWNTPAELAGDWDDLKAEEPKLRTRRAAGRLGVSEAQLLATKIGDGLTWLDGDWSELMRRMGQLERVMALTRNESAVHEVTGHYEDISIPGPVGTVLGPDVDLRLFMMRWAYGFAVETPWKGGKDGLRRSLQFFDAQGQAVHKVYLKGGSDLAAYKELVEDFSGDDQSPRWLSPEEADDKAPAAQPLPPAFDAEKFQSDWRAMQDTHEFFGLFKSHDLNRIQALEYGPEELVNEVRPEAVVSALESAAKSELPIMIFVGNRGCIQIFTGQIRKLVRTGPWFNILDPGFNLHLRDGDIDRAFVVQKPTEDGLVTSLEFYDEAGESIGLIFGERKPGIKEDRQWRKLALSLVE